jgi:uncharacterized membrane protein
MGVVSQRAKLLSFGLVVSVGVNLFFVGWILGGHWFGVKPRSFDREAVRIQLRTTLSAPGAEVVTHALDQVRQQFEHRFQDAETGRQRKSQLLVKDPFDRDAFLAESRAERTEFATGIAKADEIVAGALAQLSLEDRRKLSTMRLPPPFGTPHPPPSR